MDLLVWVLLIPSIVFAIAGGIFWSWADVTRGQNGEIDCGFTFNAFSPECSPIVYQIGRMEIAGVVFLFLLL